MGGVTVRRRHAAGLAVAATLAGCGGGPVSGGPLACDDCGSSASGVPVAPGQAVTWGVVDLENHGDRPAVVDRLTLVGRSRGLEILGVEVMLQADRKRSGYTPGLLRGRPPASAQRYLRWPRGAVIPGGGHLAVVVIASAGSRGRYGVKAVHVDYHVGSQRHRATIESALVVCVPRSARCETGL